MLLLWTIAIDDLDKVIYFLCGGILQLDNFCYFVSHCPLEFHKVSITVMINHLNQVDKIQNQLFYPHRE